MATGTIADFVIYQAEFWLGVQESLAQNLNIFNGASNNAIVLKSEYLKGNYRKESFFKTISSLVTRRDDSSVAGVTPLKMEQGEVVAVKLKRKIGPVENTADSFRAIMNQAGYGDMREFSYYFGLQAGEQILQDMINTAILSVETAISGQATNLLDITGETTKTITSSALNRVNAKLGDASGSIVAYVMHSKAYHDLIGQQISDNIFQVSGNVIYGGSPATFGKPVIVTDAPALTDAGTPDTFNTLGLVSGAVEVTESEAREFVFEKTTLKENITYVAQGETAYNIGVKGFTWDVTNGGANPDATAVGTTTNWDKVATSYKHLAGVKLLTQ